MNTIIEVSLLKRAVEELKEYSIETHNQYAEAREKWGTGNPHRWVHLLKYRESLDSLVNEIKETVGEDLC